MAESTPKVDLSQVSPKETEYATGSGGSGTGGGGGGSGMRAKGAKEIAFDYVRTKPGMTRGSGSGSGSGSGGGKGSVDTAISRHVSRSVDADSATRTSLFEGAGRGRKATEGAATPASSAQRQATGLQGTKNVMSDTLLILEANREKLAQTADKSEEMANQVRIGGRLCRR